MSSLARMGAAYQQTSSNLDEEDVLTPRKPEDCCFPTLMASDSQWMGKETRASNNGKSREAKSSAPGLE